MTTLLSWNVQNGISVSGERSMKNIAAAIDRHGVPDLICLQEITRGLALSADDVGLDEVAALSAMYPDHEPVFGAAIDLRLADGKRAQYGNLVLSRLPVLSVRCHPLPQPADPGIRQMPRVAIEVTVQADDGPLRVTSTHLDYFSERQRRAQIERLREIHAEACELVAIPPPWAEVGPYGRLPQATRALLCGDLNCTDDSAEHARLVAPQDRPDARLYDAWSVLHGARAHPPTCGVHDHRQWPMGPHCRDFFLVSESLIDCLVAFKVDVETAASDHQPLRLTLKG
ncbi:MAG: endonuclease/exonuclease/phosphatase family protein [Burkholderiaceae bacterium]|nr:endonuclease/exonuclease/phosphatase family protein [Burkholderiaceae bacterium]